MKGLKLAVLMILALTPLAVLQYRWVGVVSRAERDRIRRNLENDVVQFSQAFDRELAEIILHFRMGAASNENDLADYLQTRASAWRQSAKEPGLIKDLYFMERTRDGSRTKRWHEASGIFEDQESPKFFEQLFGLRNRGSGSSRAGSPRVRRGSPFLFDGVIPAIVLPIAHLSGARDRRGPRSGRSPFRGDRLIITLDLAYMKQEFLPGLVETYFHSATNRDHVVRVLGEGAPRPLIYESEPLSSVSPDVSGEMFRLLDVPELLEQFRETVQTETPPTADGKASANSARSIANIEGPGLWRVEVSHRSGSLAAHVARSRRNNLMINFGILAILGVGIWILVRSSQRSGRLARQQLEFVAGVSHEILTPLAAIRSAAQNLTDGVVVEPDKVRNYGAMIQKEGTRLSDMVEKVLDFAGMQAHAKNYDFQTHDLGELIRESLEECRPMLDAASFEAVVQIPEGALPVRADRESLKQVVNNLVANAVKYGGKDPRLWLRLIRQKDDFILLEAEDRGDGVPSEERAHVFEPFFRGKKARDSQIKGSGLGLCLAQNIVKAHGGKIAVFPASPNGALFRVWLPMTESYQRLKNFSDED